MIGEIKRFSRYFNDMNCTGEVHVSLQQHENVSLKEFRHINKKSEEKLEEIRKELKF